MNVCFDRHAINVWKGENDENAYISQLQDIAVPLTSAGNRPSSIAVNLTIAYFDHMLFLSLSFDLALLVKNTQLPERELISRPARPIWFGWEKMLPKLQLCVTAQRRNYRPISS